ncbi:DnaJ domain-containing protein [Wolbachia endosymbiont (group E) of Neria commutata]|uniref:DnaJ domain-containing protein n=1 Tax=Wolbachia endosymbiont (group E) of Neria commutata TaxID=3066149 RepID=UPI003132A42D
MGYRSLDEIEYEAFRLHLLGFDLQWKDCKDQDTVKLIKKRYHNLSKKFHPDKNDQGGEKIRKINHAKEVLYEFIVEPLEKGLGKRNNLVKELRNKLWKCSYEELQERLNARSRNTLKEKELSVSRNVSTYLKYSSCLKNLGEILTIITSIAFLIINGISCNILITASFFALLLVPLISGGIGGVVYRKNGKEFNRNTIRSLLSTFDQECGDFSESDRTKLKWVKNLLILNSTIFPSLMFCGVVLDLVANGFGATNSVLLSGLLLSLPSVLLVAASATPVLNTACNYILKNTTINLIEGQVRSDGKSIAIENENPESLVATGCFSSHQLAITYPEISC